MNKELIVKSNEILAHPIYKSSMELKIFSKLILELRKNPDEMVFFLKKKELLSDLGCDENNYSNLKKICEKMFRPIDINKGKGDFILRAVFVEINANFGSQIMFEISPKMKPHFINLSKNFTQYFFENIARLNSGFSIRIYEFLKQYETIGSRTVSLQEFKFFLNIDDDKYIKYSHLKSRVILSAQKELKEKTDISFEFEEIKTGRKITDIIFFIFKNKKTPPINSSKVEDIKIEKIELEEEPPESHQLEYEKLMSLGVSKSQALKLCKNHTEEKINNNIRYIEKEQEKGRKKDNIAGFLVSAIENDYYNQTQLKIDDVSLKKDEERRKKEHQQTIIDRQEKERVAKEKEVKRQQIEQFLEDIDDNDFSDLQENFIAEHVKDTFMMKYVKNNELDLSSSIIKMNFYNFIYTTCIKGLQD